MSEQEQRCEVATEVAIEAAREECTTDAALRRQIGRMLGMASNLNDDAEPEDRPCSVVLDVGITESVLDSTRQTREWVFCRAWHLVSEEDETMSTALERAWAEIESKADDMGMEV